MTSGSGPNTTKCFDEICFKPTLGRSVAVLTLRALHWVPNKAIVVQEWCSPICCSHWNTPNHTHCSITTPPPFPPAAGWKGELHAQTVTATIEMTEGTSEQNPDNSHMIAHRPFPFFLLSTSQNPQQHLSRKEALPLSLKNDMRRYKTTFGSKPCPAKFNSMPARLWTLFIPYLVLHFFECQDNLELLRYFLYRR